MSEGNVSELSLLEAHIADLRKPVKEDALPKDFDFSRIRDYAFPTLLRALAKKADTGWIPSAEETKALICTMFEVPKEKQYTLPWPSFVKEPGTSISDGKPFYINESQQKIASSRVLGDFDDLGDVPFHIGLCLPKLTKDMSNDAKADVGIWLFDHMPEFDAFTEGIDTDKLNSLFTIIGSVDPYSDGGLRIGNRFSQFLEEHIGERAIVDSPLFEGYTSDEFWYLHLSEVYNLQKPLYRSLAHGEYNKKKQKTLIGMFLRDNGVSRELNTMREMLDSQKLSSQESVFITEQLRSILGILADKPVHTTLSDLYASIRFEDYPVGNEMQGDMTNHVIFSLEKYFVGKTDQILELGSGTGWLVGALRNKGFQAIGIDASEQHVSRAKAQHGDYFHVGTWEKLQEPFESKKAVISLGRSLPHTEEEAVFLHVLAQAYNVLDDGGVFIFDMPDSQQGDYLEQVKRYRSVLRTFDFSEKEVASQWTIVDSSDGEHFYNRYVPPKEDILHMLENMHFVFRESIEQDIPNGKGDKNIIFIAQKLEHPVWEGSGKPSATRGSK